MLIVLLRHGETAYNAQRCYQGKSDIPLSARVRARLRAADFAPDVVVVTALCRTAQTAAAHSLARCLQIFHTPGRKRLSVRIAAAMKLFHGCSSFLSG